MREGLERHVGVRGEAEDEGRHDANDLRSQPSGRKPHRPTQPTPLRPRTCLSYCGAGGEKDGGTNDTDGVCVPVGDGVLVDDGVTPWESVCESETVGLGHCVGVGVTDSDGLCEGEDDIDAEAVDDGLADSDAVALGPCDGEFEVDAVGLNDVVCVGGMDVDGVVEGLEPCDRLRDGVAFALALALPLGEELRLDPWLWVRVRVRPVDTVCVSVAGRVPVPEPDGVWLCSSVAAALRVDDREAVLLRDADAVTLWERL